MKTIKEGSAVVSLQDGVFYNPKMTALRDLSVLFLNAVKARGLLLDSTAATGVRGIRYAKETGIDGVMLLDINEAAYKVMLKNLKANKVDAKAVNTSIHEFSASGQPKLRFDVIDLDPFGSPVPCMEDVMRLAKDQTILMVTATDTAVLCGAHAAACMKIYASKPIHNELCKESGIRILINYITRSAARFNFGVEVMLSVSDLHYMRVFVRLHYGAKEAMTSVRESGFVGVCSKCRAFYAMKGMVPLLGRECANCRAKVEVYGPMYLGRLKDKKVVDDMILINHKNGPGSSESLAAGRQLLRISDEPDELFFYSVPRITRILKSSSAPMDAILEGLRKGGFRAERTQFDPNGIKTDADIGTVTSCVNSAQKANK